MKTSGFIQIISLFAIVGFVALAGYFLFAKNPDIASTPPANDTQNESVVRVIKMSEEVYMPQDVEIEEGETVEFENIGTKIVWPASNIHPTHQIYPEFDAVGGVVPGAKWSFQFTKAGTWRFHDHMFPQIKGVIIVKEKNAPVEENSVKTEPPLTNEETPKESKFPTGQAKQVLPSGDEKAQDRFSTVNMMDVAKKEKELNYWLAAVGAKRVLEKLLDDAGGGSFVDCHPEAHNVGRVGYEIYGASVFRAGNASCHSGYYHGAMESFLKEKGTLNLAADISSVCDEFNTSFGRFECLHGVGHGVLAYVDYDMPESIDVCKLLDSDYARSACVGGMFMENIVTAQGRGNSPGHTTTWANQDPHFPCNAISKDYMVQYQCYQMQTSWMLTLFNYDFDRVKEECEKSPKDMIAVCFKSFGRDAAGHTLRNPQKIVDICGKISYAQIYYDECITGAVNVIIDFWGGGLKDQANELCRLLPKEGKNACYSTVAYRLRDVFGTDSERQITCAGFEEQYKNLCAS